MVPVSAMVLTLPALPACVMPLPFEDPQDGGPPPNAPPEIVLASADPSMLVEQTIESGETARTFQLTVRDNDVKDTLYVRVYRDYQASPSAAVLAKEISGCDDPCDVQVLNRVITLETTTWCVGVEPGKRSIFEVVVTDRQFEDFSVLPVFRATKADAGVARSYWVGTCQ